MQRTDVALPDISKVTCQISRMMRFRRRGLYGSSVVINYNRRELLTSNLPNSALWLNTVTFTLHTNPME